MTDLKGKLYVAIVDDEKAPKQLMTLGAKQVVGDEYVLTADDSLGGIQIAERLYAGNNKVRWYIDGLNGEWRNVVDSILERGGSYSDICLVTSIGDFITEHEERGGSGITKPIKPSMIKNDLESYWRSIDSDQTETQ